MDNAIEFGKVNLTENSVLVIKSDYIDESSIRKIRILLSAHFGRKILVFGIGTHTTLGTIEVETAKKVLKNLIASEESK